MGDVVVAAVVAVQVLFAGFVMPDPPPSADLLSPDMQALITTGLATTKFVALISALVLAFVGGLGWGASKLAGSSRGSSRSGMGIGVAIVVALIVSLAAQVVQIIYNTAA